jgi:hypothetical protein
MANKMWMVACSAILGCATTAMTQTAPPSQSNPSTADPKITVTGCLAAAPANAAASTATGSAATTGTTGTTGATGTAGTAGTTASAETFQLTNATAAAADPNAAAVPATEAANATAGQTYRLIANPTALNPHIGKKLALTGTLDAPDGAATSAATAAGSEPKALVLRVESGKVIAESCAQQ